MRPSIRALLPEDLEDCIPLGASFYREGQLPGSFVPGVFRESWETLLDLGIGKIYGAWADEQLVGIIGGALVPDVNDGELVANEMFWYVLPQHRGVGYRLLRRYLKEMRRAGAKRITMVHLNNLMPDRLRRVYERLGLEALETHYKGVFR